MAEPGLLTYVALALKLPEGFLLDANTAPYLWLTRQVTRKHSREEKEKEETR